MPVQASLAFPPSHFLAGPGLKGHMQDETILDSLDFDPNAVPSPHAVRTCPPTQSGKAQVLSLGY